MHNKEIIKEKICVFNLLFRVENETNFFLDTKELKSYFDENSYINSKSCDKENIEELYENLMKVKKEKLISKVSFLKSVPYKILFHYISSNEYFLLIKAYNQTDQKCFKEIKISHDKFLKIISKINHEEIIPKNMLYSFINNKEIFTDKILSHISYLFENSNSIKIGISNKPVGLLFSKKYMFEFLDSKTATVDLIVLKKMYLRMFIINDIIE